VSGPLTMKFFFFSDLGLFSLGEFLFREGVPRCLMCASALLKPMAFFFRAFLYKVQLLAQNADNGLFFSY